MKKTRVITTKKVVTTINMFPYGNKFRVQYTRVANDPEFSTLLTAGDQSFVSEVEAEDKFDRLVHIFGGGRNA
jgi:hypothetical protein